MSTDPTPCRDSAAEHAAAEESRATPGGFCHAHWSWLCGRGQGKCQQEPATTPPAYQTGGPVLPPGPVELQPGDRMWTAASTSHAEDDPCPLDPNILHPSALQQLRYDEWRERQRERESTPTPPAEADAARLAAIREAVAIDVDANPRARADMAWLLSRMDSLTAERAGLPEWHCPACGAVTRAWMADWPEPAQELGRLRDERDRLAAQVADVRAVLDTVPSVDGVRHHGPFSAEYEGALAMEGLVKRLRAALNTTQDGDTDA